MSKTRACSANSGFIGRNFSDAEITASTPNGIAMNYLLLRAKDRFVPLKPYMPGPKLGKIFTRQTSRVKNRGSKPALIQKKLTTD